MGINCQCGCMKLYPRKNYITIQSIAQVLKCENNGIPIDSLTSLSMVKLVSMILVESLAAFL